MPQVKDDKSKDEKPIDVKPVDPKEKDKEPITAAKQKATKDFLKSKGHSHADALDISDHSKLRAEVLKLHGMTEEMYRQGAI